MFETILFDKIKVTWIEVEWEENSRKSCGGNRKTECWKEDISVYETEKQGPLILDKVKEKAQWLREENNFKKKKVLKVLEFREDAEGEN